MSNHDELVNQFISMTNASDTQARFYLESSNWDLQLAVTQYFDNNQLGSDVTEPATTPTKRKVGSSSSSKIRTLGDLSSSQTNESDDDEHENLYAGGEKSGVAVQGPNKRAAAGGHNLVDEILKKAAEGGPAPEEEAPQVKKKPSYYTGAGYRLGSEDEPSTLATPVTPEVPAIEEEPEPVTRHLTFWRNGFSVDDGPLYEYSDPANQEMLTAINSGRAPLSLLNVRYGQPVEVRVVKRQDEDYTPPPKAPPKPFEGKGNRLGGPSSTTVEAGTSAPGSFPASSSSSGNAAPAIDETQPTTSIQIRLGDGSRLVAKLNHTHTVGDIRQFIEASNGNSRPYILQTTFPVKELTDNNQTIKEAGLLNSVIVQRYQ